MGEVAEKFSDLSIITSDNPRSENPIKIIEDIKKGFLKNSSFLIEVDRKKAISKAMSMANKDDIVLIAGKGHENYQIFSNKTVSFNDKEIVQMLSN